MFLKLLLLVLIFFVSTVLSQTDDEVLLITVDADEGCDVGSCQTGNEPCATINFALQALHQAESLSLHLHIGPGHYNLTKSNDTRFQNCSSVEITGNGTADEVIIECLDKVALTFFDVNNVTISNITLLGCGDDTLYSSSTKNESFLKYTVAMYMYECDRISLFYVHINSSIGTGLTIYNPTIAVSIVGSIFAHNSLINPANYTDNSYGGSGLQIEFTYCNIYTGTDFLWTTNSSDCQTASLRVANDTLITVQDTKFIENIAYQGDFFSYKNRGSKMSNFAFGKGGGFSITFKGYTKRNKLIFSNIELTGNKARYGGGFYISFNDKAVDNTIHFTNFTIHENSNIHPHNSWDADESGGGGKIIFKSQNLTENNNITLRGFEFCQNTAIAGGGLSLEVRMDPVGTSNNILITNSDFTLNSAFLGSATYFSQAFLSSCDTKCLSVVIEKSRFINNLPTCEKTDTTLNFASLPCSGAVYSSYIPLILKDHILFERNYGSALDLYSSYIEVEPETSVNFSDNAKTTNGGAISLHGCSYILIHQSTNFQFIRNSAYVFGGAIYSGTCTSNNQPTTLTSKCFLQYFDSSESPLYWDTKFTFTDNRANNKPSSIYAVEAISCWWQPEGNMDYNLNNNLNTTFCWNHNWTYSAHGVKHSCRENIMSSAAYISVDNAAVGYPGQIISLPITIYDGTGSVIYNHHKDISINDFDVEVCIKSGPASLHKNRNSTCSKVPPNGVPLFQYNDANYTDDNSDVVLNVRASSLQVNVKFSFLRCPWPFESSVIANNITQCVLLNKYFCCSAPNNLCDCNQKCEFYQLLEGNIKVRQTFGHCITDELDKVHGLCPAFYYDYSFFTYTDSIKNIVGKCQENRTGPLCGQCEANYSIPLNSLYMECVDCFDDSTWGWALFLLLQILPETLVVLLVIILNLKITNGTVSGYILYSQIVSLYVPGWLYPAWLTNLWSKNNYIICPNPHLMSDNKYKLSPFTVPFSIWNLNFLVGFPPSTLNICLTESMDALGTISLSYIMALYPLVILLVLYIWMLMYNEGYHCVVRLTRPVHNKLARFWQALKIEPSLTDSIAVIYLLCYTQLVNISLNLLRYTPLYDIPNESFLRNVFFYDGAIPYFGWPHALPAIFGIAVMIFVVILPTLYLLLFQFRVVQKCLNFVRLQKQGIIALVDVLTGGFHKSTKTFGDHRYFAGLFLLLRAAIVGVYFIPYDHVQIIPYFQMSLTVIAAGTVMIVRPYIVNLHNYTNFIMLLNLTLLSALTYLDIPNESPDTVFVPIIVVMYVPLFFSCVYFLFWCFTKVLLLWMPRKAKTYRQTASSAIYNSIMQRSSSLSVSFADRVLHPNEYVYANEDQTDEDGDPVPLQITSSVTYGSINNNTNNSGSSNSS